MSFTYDISSTNTTTLVISQIRLAIGDNVENAGALPTSANFSDAELLLFYANEGDNVYRATAAACETLGRNWARVGDIATGDVSKRSSNVAKEWRAEAARLRSIYGTTGGAGQAYSAAFTRKDGYADDAN